MHMRQPKLNIWIPQYLLDQVLDEANKFFPNETGGLLMGYYVDKQQVIVITDIVDAGPKAIHTPTSFIPDYKYQEQEIAKLYELSGRLHTYLGDWHSHPTGSPTLSGKDKRTLGNIAIHSPARAPEPIMLMLGGITDRWKIKFWKLRPKKLLGFSITGNINEIERIV